MNNQNDKGVILYQGIVVGEIQRCNEFSSLYKFTYDPGFNECFGIDDLELRDEPHFINAIPFIMYSHMLSISSDVLNQMRDRYNVRDDFELWLACCNEGLIKEDDGCKVTW